MLTVREVGGDVRAAGVEVAEFSANTNVGRNLEIDPTADVENSGVDTVTGGHVGFAEVRKPAADNEIGRNRKTGCELKS